MQAETICKNCGNRFSGHFCNQCGEKVYTEHDKTFGHFLEEGFHFITHFDSKLLRTWWLVMTRPGFVSKEISTGVRKRYYKPVNLFIIGVILYLLFPLFEGLNIPLRYHEGQPYKAVAGYMVKKKMESGKMTPDELVTKFDSKSPKFAKILLLVIIPLSALVLQLLFLGKRRFFFDHITLAAELNSFYLYFTFFIMPVLFVLILLLMKLFTSAKELYLGDEVSMPVYFAVLGIYSGLAFRRFYAEKKALAVIKSILFLALHYIIVYIIYRFILFTVVLFFI